MRVALIGATGLVGGILAGRLSELGHEVHALQRRPGGADGVSVHVAEPETWKSLIEEIRPETAISALGTTMRKAGSEAVFRTVDYEMVLAFALAARAAGAHRMVTVSSVGAAAASSNFYLRIKGEMERDLRSLGFHRLDVFRPGLLRGERGTDRRLAERIGILVSPVVDLFLQGPFARYASTPAAGLAEAVAGALLDDRPGAFVWENPHFFWLADELWPYL